MYTANTLNEAIQHVCGENISILSRQPVFGGDINRAYALRLSDGSVIFMEANTKQKLAIFQGEAESLDFIRQTGTIRSPEVLAIGTDGSTLSFFGRRPQYIGSGPFIPIFLITI